MRAITVTTEAQRKAAIDRAHELKGCTNGSDEERELKAIVDAVAAYDAAKAVPGASGKQPTGPR
jgi:hypothetical protein